MADVLSAVGVHLCTQVLGDPGASFARPTSPALHGVTSAVHKATTHKHCDKLGNSSFCPTHTSDCIWPNAPSHVTHPSHHVMISAAAAHFQSVHHTPPTPDPEPFPLPRCKCITHRICRSKACHYYSTPDHQRQLVNQKGSSPLSLEMGRPVYVPVRLLFRAATHPTINNHTTAHSTKCHPLLSCLRANNH